jgi:hypothetical protein
VAKKDQKFQVIPLLQKLIEDQDAILATLDVTVDLLKSHDKPDSAIHRMVANSREAAIFKRDKISVEGYATRLIDLHRALLIVAVTGHGKKSKKQDIETRIESFTKLETEFKENIILDTVNPDPYLALFQKLYPTLFQPKTQPTMTQALFVLACANFESFLSGLLTILLEANDTLLYGDEDKFTWQQVSTRGAIPKLRAILVAKNRDTLLKKSAKEWIKWFETRSRLDLPAELKTSVLNIYALRNKFAHEGSSLSMRTSEVSEKRLREALDTFLELATRFAVAGLTTFSANFADEQQHTKYMSTNMTLELIKKNRFNATVALGEPLLELPGPDMPTTQVNIWIAKRKAGLTDDYLKAVSTWDTSKLPRVFQLAKYALLGDVRKSRALAKKLLATKELQLVDWQTWPLFDDVRGRALR